MQTFWDGYTWDNDKSAWVGAGPRCEFAYNNQGKTLYYISLNWDNSISDWVYDYKYDYSYDSSNNLMTSNYSTWDAISTAWNLHYRSRYYYQTPAGIPDITKNGITVYPNPVSDILHISGLKEGNVVSMNDLNGRIVFNRIKWTGMIDVASLPVGVYYLQITSGKETVKTKFIKK